MVHAPILLCLTQATLIEIGLLICVEDERPSCRQTRQTLLAEFWHNFNLLCMLL